MNARPILFRACRRRHRGFRVGPVTPGSLRILGVALLVGSAGCGTNIEEILFQTATAAGRTFVDILLTDIANTLADELDPLGDSASTSEEDGGGGDGGTTTDGADEGAGDGGALEDLIGDPAAGETVFTSNGCAACHCADAGGGCALSAPSLVGAQADVLDAFLRQDVQHTGGKFDLSDQGIVDLQAYLASL